VPAVPAAAAQAAASSEGNVPQSILEGDSPSRTASAIANVLPIDDGPPSAGDRVLDAVVGDAFVMQSVKSLLKRVASSRASTVLLTGETGTGKDLVARTIHNISDRAKRPFTHITCSALPDQLLESELFGHERGAFTDARVQKPGLFEVSDKGTVFLDEIGEMALPLQAKLIRFLEDKTFKRVGGLRDIHVDVRIIAATHRDLRRQVSEDRFREDLFYRLNVLSIHLPPLRERIDDVPLLVDYFVNRYNDELGKAVRGVRPAALERLKRYGWPGNVRELRNTIERAMLLSDSPWLESADVSIPVHPSNRPRFELPPDGVKLQDVERELIVQALERVQGHQMRAAELLGINRDQVRYRIQKYRLSCALPPSTRPHFELPVNGVRLDVVERKLLVQALERAKWNQSRAAGLLGINRDQVRYRMQKYRLPWSRKPRAASHHTRPLSQYRSRTRCAVA